MAQSMAPMASPPTLTLSEELILMLLDEETGYFRQVPGWNLNCVVVGAVLAELSLRSRIDTDLESLTLEDRTETGDPVLDSVLKEIAGEPERRNARYWIERLASRAEDIIDQRLDQLVDLKILVHHPGDFWTVSPTAWQVGADTGAGESTVVEYVKTRISRIIFSNEIPEPWDIIIICLLETCDITRFIFQLDEETEKRIELICKMDLIGRSIADAVADNMAGPMLQRPALTKAIPTVPLRHVIFSRHLRSGNLPALFAELAEKHGPVFRIHPPFAEPMIFLAGPRTNRWAHRHGRMYLRARDYLEDFEKVYGASGILPALDGTDHFRFRKSMHQAYSRGRLAGRLDDLFRHGRDHMAGWKVGESLPAVKMTRRLSNASISPLFNSVDSQDLVDGMIEYKERALCTHLIKVLPKFMLHTPGMKRRANNIQEVLDRVQRIHTPAQRAGCPRDFADDLLSLHKSDPQFLPESNLRFALSAPLIASMYVGDMLGFAFYAMATQPGMYERIRSEADAVFDNGDPDSDAFDPSVIDVTRRFVMEVARLYPIVPVSVRTVMNSCVVEGYELPEGSRTFIAQSAAHYMSDVFPEPFSFDIDRYLPSRKEHVNPGYAPFGVGTHTCLGQAWVELFMAAHVLLLAHHFTIKVFPEKHRLKIAPFPSLSLSKKFKFHVTEKRREIPV